MLQHIPICNLTQDGETGKGKIAGVDAKNPDFRWQAGLEDERCKAILQALYDANAYSPRFALSARAIGRLIGLHHQVIRRLIRGDKRCRAKLKGLVAWLAGRKGQKTRYWLTPEGRKVAELLAKGFPVGKATLKALATDRDRRKLAHQPEVAHQTGTPSENNMLSNDSFNVCSLTAVGALKPVRKRLSSLAARLWRDYGIQWWVAEDLAARYSPIEIEAAIALRERRNGAIYNGAGFIVYLLSHGFARSYVRARLQARQRPRPTRKPPDEPDLDAIVAALREALEPYSIPVADDCAIELPNCRLRPFLDGDPATVVAKTLDLLMRHGLLPNGNGQDADQDPADATDQAPTEATEADLPADPTDSDDDDEIDDGEPLPPLKCELCGRSQGEPHPALQSWQSNDFLCLSELSDDFKQRFGLPECGLLCRGCYLTLCRTLVTESPSDEATDAPLAADDLHNAPADATDDLWAADPTDEAEANPADQDAPANEPTEPASDQNQSDGQNDPSNDRENCPSLTLLPLPERVADAFQPVVNDLLMAYSAKGATEIVEDGVTYRLKELCPLEGGLAFVLTEVDATTLPPAIQAMIDELCRLYRRDGTVAIERDGFRVEIAEVIPVTQGKTLYRFSITKLGRGRKR